MAQRFKSPSKITDILPNSLKAFKIEKKLLSYDAVVRWPEIVGEKISQHTAAKSIYQDTLIVEVDHPTWLIELQMMETNILKKIKAEIPKSPIKKIRFVN